MKPRIMITGALLIIGAILGHYVTPNVISQVDVLTSPLQGNLVCGLSKDIQTHQSPVATPSSVDQFFHENICSTLSFSETVLELGAIGVGFIGVGVIIIGGLTNQKRKNSPERSSRIAT